MLQAPDEHGHDRRNARRGYVAVASCETHEARVRIFPTENGHGRSARPPRVTAEYQSDSSSKPPTVSPGACSISKKKKSRGDEGERRGRT